MKKRSFKIKTLPKYWDGGPLHKPTSTVSPEMGGSGGAFNFNSLLQGMSAMPSNPESNRNQEFADYVGNDSEARTAKQVDMGINAVGAIPGWGTAVAAGLKAGQAVGKQTKDEYGIYKSGAGEFIDKSFNPTEGISGLKTMFDDPSFDNISNQLTLGLVGKNTRQEELMRKKKMFEFDNVNKEIGANERNGSMLKNSLPVYQAPAYGREGLKLRVGRRYSSKFSNFK